MTIAELDELIKAVCPIVGINSNGAIWFDPAATLEQQAQAEQLMLEHKDTLTGI